MLTASQKEALNLEHHISLTANAGSGKTFVLSNRFIDIAMLPGVQLQEIVAITFTDAAAGELFEKISKRFDEEISEASDDKRRNRLKNLRRQLVTANISTIHSFCISLLRRYPVEAEIDAGFTPMDEIQSGENLALSIEAAVKEAFNDPAMSENLKFAVRIFGSLPALKKQLARLVNNRKNFLPLFDSVYCKTSGEIKNFYLQKSEEHLRYLTNLIRKNYLEIINQINDHALNNSKKNKTAGEVREVLAALNPENYWNYIGNISAVIENMLTKQGTLKKAYIKEEIFTNEAGKIFELKKILKDIPPQPDHQALEELADFGSKIAGLFKLAYNHYERRKTENGLLDFDDILLKTERILQFDPVLEDLADRYKYIMVDEYQDTNDVQYHIFLPILGQLSRGNLFVVGDDKQSIYMFRDAELKVFEQTLNDIGNNEGKDLTLPESFRMAPGIAMFNNYVFEQLFRDPDPRFNEVKHEEIICAKKEDLFSGVEFIIPPADSENENDRTKDKYIALADSTAKWIAEFVNRDFIRENLTFKNIAVLCRKRKQFPLIEKAFTEAGIPYSIMGGTGFYQHQIVLDFYNLFSFLINKENSHALAGILRSPFFMVSDAELFSANKVRGEYLWSKLLNYNSADVNLLKARKLLSRYIELAITAEPLSIIRSLTKETSYLSVIASRKNGESELENFSKFINITMNFFLPGMRNIYDFVLFLKNAIDNIENESQGGTEAVLDDNTVKIMTIHQAKGLEFETVILFDLNDQLQLASVDKGELIIDKDFGLLAKLPLNRNYSEDYISASTLPAYKYYTDRKLIAEVKRLLYVAFTRAKNYLIIASHSRTPDRKSYLSMILESLNINLANGDIFELSGSLKMMSQTEAGGFTLQNEVLPVKIISEFGETSKFTADEKTFLSKTDKSKPLADYQSGEIVSATIYSIFRSCPTKYFLTYKLGYGDVLELFDDSEVSTRQFTVKSSDGDEISMPEPKVLGNIIHRLLEKQSKGESIENIEIPFMDPEDESGSRLNEYILEMIGNVRRSDPYRRSELGEKIMNEFSVSVRLNGFTGFGRIDRLSISGDKAIIIDYKTGALTPGSDKVRQYFDQLSFYAMIINKMNPQVTDFELILLPVKDPGSPLILNAGEKEIKEVSTEVEKMINKIRFDDFDKNTSHCKFCGYYINNKCSYP